MMYNKFLRNKAFHLSLCWIAGLLIGLFLAFFGRDAFSALTQGSLAAPFSILGLILSIVLPIGIALLAYFTRRFGILCLIVVLKAFLYGYCLYFFSIVCQLHGTSIVGLFLFGQNTSSLLLLFLSFLLISEKFVSIKRITASFIFASVVLVLISAILI